MEHAEALVSIGPSAAEVRDVPVLNGGPGGQANVLASGVCGTDIDLFAGNALAERIRPFVLGHENVVRISGLDEATARRWSVSEGDRVLVEEYVPCGHCATCRAGNYRVCPATDFLRPEYHRYGRMPASVPGPWGGFGELLHLHPDARLHAVPDDLASHVATLAVPLANAHRWLTRVTRSPVGGAVAVIGPGAIGLCAVAIAREAGASFVALIGTDGDERRLAAGRALGADLAVSADPNEVVRLVEQATAGAMADTVLDATGGAAAALDLAGLLAGFGADVVLAGAMPQTTALLRAAAEREVSVRGARGHDGTSIDAALRLLASKRYPFPELVTEPVDLPDAAATLGWLTSGDPDRPIHVSIARKGKAQ